jgi:sortase A
MRRFLLNSSAAALAALALVFFSEGLWIKAKAELAQVLLDRAFAQSVTTGRPVKPWRWADTWPVARIEVPRLGVSAIVLAGGSGQALAFGPGHLEQTPHVGEPGTAVYAAHRDTHFAFLGQVKKGDEIRITRADGVTLSYFVRASEVVPWNRPNIDPDASGYHLALATCWPLDAQTRGSERLVVHAEMYTLPEPRHLLSDEPHG